MKTDQPTRAIRIASMRRQKDKARRLIRDVWGEEVLATDPAFVGKRARTRVPCSCPHCGNIRHHADSGKNSLTMQERMAALRGAEEE